MLLEALPGYTREALENENPQLVERWIIALNERAAVRRSEEAKAKQASRRRR